MVVAVSNTLTELYPATPQSVVDARNWAAEFATDAGASDDTVEAVRLAVSEAVTNVVLHAYAPKPAGTDPRGDDATPEQITTAMTNRRARRSGPENVQVTLAVTGNEMWILVADNGRGHQTAPISPGLGWGLALIADAADDFLITERSGGGTELQMRFSLPFQASAPSGAQLHRFSGPRPLRAE